jgi:phage tail-like protein
MPARDGSKDPYLGCRFVVEIDSLTVGGFSEVSGLVVEVETEDYQEGGVNDYVHKLPKGIKYPNLVLKRGITDSDELWKWYEDVVNGKIKHKNGSIILLDSEGNVKRTWTFEDVYPIKWTGPDFKADNSAIAIESLELVHKGLIRKG